MWKKGRNQHARALLCGLRSGRLAPPFDAGPRDEPLGAGISSACAAAVGLHRGAQQMPAGAKKKPRPPLVPGTASLRLAPPLLLAEEEEEEEEESSYAAGASASAAFARAGLPSRVELAAALGSARERIAELEWRLGERERGAKAKEWGASVAAARASAALPSSAEPGEEGRSEHERRRHPPPPSASAAADAASVPASPQGVEAKKRPPPSPLPPNRAAAAAAEAAAEAAPRLPPLLKRPKASAAAPVATITPQRKQKTLIPSFSLEELSRRISALAPQQ